MLPVVSSYQVGQRQMLVHVAGEAMALAVLVPLTLWVATRSRELSRLERVALVTGAITSIVIDGVLLYRNIRIIRGTS